MLRRRSYDRVLCVFFLCVLCVSVVRSSSGAEPWATYRGNAERTACTDGKAGPAAPKVLWALKSKEHFIAAPVPHGKRLFVSSLGAFNVAHFSCLDSDPAAKERTLWTKSTPYLKLPTVSSPALSGGRIVFGDGMHQTDGAALHCLLADGGLPLWQLPVPGKLVHLEGSPTIEGGKVYIGGGAAGVLCLDLDRVTLEGKEMKLAEVQKVIAQRWQALLAKYEEEKKKDKDFAVPPSEDQLPRAAPRRLWQQGEKQWHVDAPVAVVGERVLVGTSFLDREREGDRALCCLDAKTGKVLWRTPLKFNPWGGPSVSGKLVVVGGSSIGYDPALLRGAKGEVVALDLETGAVKWRKDVKGGVVGSVALVDGAAVATATDGKVRAWELADGTSRWVYDAKAPFFAPPAAARGVVYAGDLRGAVHAIDLTGGARKWVLDLAREPQVMAPGMIYGGPALQDGRLYVATCNLAGVNTGMPTAVVCIGEK
ncbi:MAG: PQQ-binding-like beta-propeller repeat protein [Gemmataceae bacterium]|nr:PQQ-binding-like beta-propeller repeat protein [Gemmataceae bacterium]